MREQLKRFMYPVISGVVLAGAFAAVTVYANWTAPTAAPPTCATGSPGCDVPLHTGAAGQIKRGGLSVGEGLGATSLGLGVINGRVGIGTVTPQANVHVYGGPDSETYIGFGPNPYGTGAPNWIGPAANFGYAGVTFGRGAAFLNTRGASGTTAPNPSVRIGVDTIERVIVTNTGDVGIGTAANLNAAIPGKGGPGTNAPLLGRLQVEGKADVSDSILFLPGADTSNAGTPSIRVGIGTVTPGETLDVAGNARVSGNISSIRGVPYTWPAAQGGAGQALTNNGSGVLSWATVSGGGSGLPAGVVGNTLWHNGTAWAASSNIFNNNANIGIGTVNPTTKLDVSGDINTSGVYRVDGTVGVTDLITCPAGSTPNNITVTGGIVTAAGACTAVGGGLTGGGTINFLSKFTAAGVLGNSQVFDNGTSVGIGTAAPARKLEVSGATTGIRVTDTDLVGNAFVELNTQDGGVSLFQNTAGRTRIFVGGLERMTFLNTGNVGIGDPTPTDKLNVTGLIRATNDICTDLAGGKCLSTVGGTSPGGANGNIQFNNAGAFAGSNNLFWDNATGRLGILDPTPAAALAIGAGDLFQVTSTGLVRAPNGSFAAPAYSFVGDPNAGMYSGGADILRFVTAGVDRMTINAAGRVGIGTITPGTGHSAPATVGLDVAGRRITGVQDPVDDDDAVSLGYLRAQSGGESYIVTTQANFMTQSGSMPTCGFPAPFCPSGWTAQTSWTYTDGTNIFGDAGNPVSWNVTCKRETLCMKP